MHLQELNHCPEALLSCNTEALHTLFPQPTLIHLPGKQQAPLFISVLLHGNENTGFLALQRLLNKYAGQLLPRAISIFLGNTQAAAKGLRRLEHQPDYNRIWPNTDLNTCPETEFSQQIVNIMRDKQVFASIDIHNNTGLNPHYACINKLEAEFLQLANLFSRLVVYFKRPLGVQSMAFSELCPAVTLECGRPGQQYGEDHAFNFLNDCLHLSAFSTHAIQHQEIDLFHTTAQVKIPADRSFSFTDQQADFYIDHQIDHLNFTEIKAGTHFGQVNNNLTLPIIAIDEQGKEVTEDFFEISNQQLKVKRPTMPSMLTLDERIIRQDCLCYLMERLTSFPT